MFRIVILVLALALLRPCLGETEHPLLLQKPTVSATQIVFAFADDLWIVDRHGGDARRLTTGVGVETDPRFSPDGTQIAFTGEYDGNTDVYLIPAAGGIPRRLTWHPASDQVVGWTPDGKRVLFRSGRNNAHFAPRLFTVSTEGGMPSAVPLPIASEGSYAPDGARLAYVPGVQQGAWKRYRGGQTTPIWIADLATSRIVDRAPRNNTNDFNPMWVQGRVYFLSDRSGPVTLLCYDTATKKVSEVVKNHGLDIKSASLGPGAIVYEQFGTIHLFDLVSGTSHPVEIHLAGDLPEVRPHYVKTAERINAANLSPSGARAVFGARGEIFTVPAEKGNARNLTNTPAVDERDPAWSPDGKWIAYLSDESGEYALHVRSQDGKGEVKKIDLGKPPSFFYSPIWSPDSKKIAYSDKRLNLWYVEVDRGVPVKVDTNPKPLFGYEPAWSPDSKWIAYARQLPSYMRAVFAYSLDAGKSYQLTDGLSDARYPVWDRSGKYLYFTASTDVGLSLWFADMSAMNRPVTRSVYLIVLRKGLPSPLAPESDEEKPKEETASQDGKPESGTEKPKEESSPQERKPESGADTGKEKKAEEKAPEPVRIDPDHISQRIVALPLPARNYTALVAGKAGTLFLTEAPTLGPGSRPLQRFELKSRKAEKVLDNVSSFTLSANDEKLLYRQGSRWAIVSATGSIDPGKGTLDLDEMEAYVDPPAEWREMYREAWRGLRDFFYAPNLHGLDLAETEKRYEPYLERLGSRRDLNYLFREMLGEVTISHMYAGGGDAPRANPVRGGLLGADYTIERGHYRFARVYDGENWNPEARAPLTQPGVDVVAGEYLLAVNGREVLPTEEVYAYFEGTAGKQITLKVGPSPDGSGAREVTVVPVEDEYQLRYLAWIEDNRRKVDELSGSRLAYVHMPDTGSGGYDSFNRYFFAQVGKEGALIDERFNGGGALADYVIDYLRRPLQAYFTQREGEDFAMPTAAIFGPKAMLINEFAGSGGDYMPWAFRDAKIGPLIGKRTWGGLVGVSGISLMDGGATGAPQSGFWNPNGTWDVENWGVEPDIEVELDPALWRAGRDPQLERAVAVLMDALKRNPLPRHRRPPYPRYQRGQPVTARRPGDAAARQSRTERPPAGTAEVR
jgi:tricorn protease